LKETSILVTINVPYFSFFFQMRRLSKIIGRTLRWNVRLVNSWASYALNTLESSAAIRTFTAQWVYTAKRSRVAFWKTLMSALWNATRKGVKSVYNIAALNNDR